MKVLSLALVMTVAVCYGDTDDAEPTGKVVAAATEIKERTCPGCVVQVDSLSSEHWGIVYDAVKHLNEQSYGGCHKEIVSVENFSQQTVDGYRYTFGLRTKCGRTGETYKCDMVVLDSFRNDGLIFEQDACELESDVYDDYKKCKCQCSGFTYKDAWGTTHGNCRTSDPSTRLWCYVEQDNLCTDLSYDWTWRKYKSYQACTTPAKNTDQCRRAFATYNGR